jgi:uncharacterized membrane protein/thiol-disulfide isomerase/thioredoxin
MKLLTVVMMVLALCLGLAVSAWAQTAPPPVRAVLFFSPTCPHCHYVMDEVLPPLRVQYGEQLEILKIDASQEAGAQLYYAAIEALAIPQDRFGVPTLIIGEAVLVGSAEIPEQLPGLIEHHLREGVSWPAIPGLEAALPQPTALPMGEPADPVVQALLFWSSDCPACRKVVDDTLPALQARHGNQLDIQLVDVVTADDVDRLYQVAMAYGVSKDAVNLPLLLIGDQVLLGSQQISAELPRLIEQHLAAGGVAAPDVTDLAPAPATTASESVGTASNSVPDGFALAIAVRIGMAGALVYTGVALARTLQGAPPPILSNRLRVAVPLLALIGLGVAAYLAYVETLAVSAVCGPVGDCNAVQSSPYARLFGWLPIGVLGVVGYVAILLTWWWGRSQAGLAAYAPLAVFGMTLTGMLFSLYLTYLEPFVIRALCIWCLTSAVIMTLLALVSVPPALQALTSNHHREA